MTVAQSIPNTLRRDDGERRSAAEARTSHGPVSALQPNVAGPTDAPFNAVVRSHRSVWFTRSELRAVGIAAAMMSVIGTVVIVGMTIMLGHYNSLVHSGPKAAVDGFVLALLLAGGRRWRCAALLGAVYGLVLLVQIGLVYISVVMAIAGLGAAFSGWVLPRANRAAAVIVAAICFELLASLGAPIKIVLGTSDGREPILWMLWFAEWPLRVAGVVVGVVLAKKFLSRRESNIGLSVDRSTARAESLPLSESRTHTNSPNSVRSASFSPAVAISMAIIGAVLPMWLDTWTALATTAVLFVAYGWLAGLRRALLTSLLAIGWGWIVFAAASFVWHQDSHRVVDLLRTLALRFTPMTIAAVVVARQVRPLDLLRFLRKLRLPSVLLLPLAQVARSIPPARREVRRAVTQLRVNGDWRGPLSLFVRPVTITRAVIGPLIDQWAGQLRETDEIHAADCRRMDK